MLRADLSSAFLGQTETWHGRAGPFDRALLGRGLGQMFADALAEPIPDDWGRLLRSLDERAAESESDEG